MKEHLDILSLPDVDRISVGCCFKSVGTFYKVLYRLLVDFRRMTDFINSIGAASIFMIIDSVENDAMKDKLSNIQDIDEIAFVSIIRPIVWLLYSSRIRNDNDIIRERKRILDPFGEADPNKEAKALIDHISLEMNMRIIDIDDDTIEGNTSAYTYMTIFYKNKGNNVYTYGYLSKDLKPVIGDEEDDGTSIAKFENTRMLHIGFSIEDLENLYTTLVAMTEGRCLSLNDAKLKLVKHLSSLSCEIQQKIDDLKKIIEKKKTEFHYESNLIQGICHGLEAVKSSAEVTKKEICSAKNEKKALDASLKDLNKAVDVLRKKDEKLVYVLRNKGEEFNEKTRNMHAMESDLTSLVVKKKSLISEIASLNSEIASRRKELTETRVKADVAKKEAKESRIKLEDQLGENSKIVKEQDRILAENNKIIKENERLIAEKNQLLAEQVKRQNDIQVLNKQIDEDIVKKSNLEKCIECSVLKLEMLKNKNENIEIESEKTRKNLDQMISQCTARMQCTVDAFKSLNTDRSMRISAPIYPNIQNPGTPPPKQH